MLVVDKRKSKGTISVVRQDQLSAETSQTSGSQRLSAISAAHGVTSTLWAGTFLVEPGAKTGIHHHGKQDTAVFVLAGEAIVRWGISARIVQPCGQAIFFTYRHGCHIRN